jgi:ABC-type glutathione transport system ATPase component
MRKIFDLRLQILALYLLLVIPFLSILFLFARLAASQMEQDAQASNFSLTQAIAQETAFMLQDMLQAVEQLASYEAIRQGDIEAMRPLFRLMLETHPQVNLVYRLDRRGIMLYHYPTFGRENHPLHRAAEIADEILELVGLKERAEQLAGSLNIAQKKRLEMARALAAHPYLLLLDEVLAGLNPSEVEGMLNTIRAIRDRGITIIMIEHLMHAIMNVSERIIVLDYGEQIAEGTPQEISNNPRVIQAYLGDPNLAKRLFEEVS